MDHEKREAGAGETKRRASYSLLHIQSTRVQPPQYDSCLLFRFPKRALFTPWTVVGGIRNLRPPASRSGGSWAALGADLGVFGQFLSAS